MPQENYIPYLNLVEHLGIQAGDVLLVASDLTRLAFQAKRNEGGFDMEAFIDSFILRLGPDGTLVLPSYNFMLRSGSIFDPAVTVPATGAMPFAAFHRKDFVRTWHPLHSFLVWGNKAGELESLRNRSSFSGDSPFAKFHEWNAKMLFIGTNVAEAFTYVHHVEETEQVNYRKYARMIIKYHRDSKFYEEEEILFYRKRWGWTMNLDKLQDLMLKEILESRVINKIDCSMLHIQKADEIIRRDFSENKARNIAHFEGKLYLRDMIKHFLQYFHIYKTTQDKINDGTGL
jgi:aminoglycoside 3-N-acetyltransferase